MKTPTTREEAVECDVSDPLATYRDQFHLPEGVIYLDGNSLGPPPTATLHHLRQAAENEWAQGLIKSWNAANWINLPTIAGGKIARLIGAPAGDVLVGDSVSVNIFKIAAALLADHEGAIAFHRDEFPTDSYILQGLSRLAGRSLIALPPEADAQDLTPEIGVVVKSMVHYKSAAIADISRWEDAAARCGAAIIWDLSHAAGLLDLRLSDWGAKFAVGCGYKYLNGGPGAPAFLYVSHEKADQLHQPLSGWMGHAAPFEFSPDYAPAPGVKRFACGTPPILSLSALDAALNLFADIEMKQLAQKAQTLGDIFYHRLTHLGFETVTPPAPSARGGHVSFRSPHGYTMIQALIAEGVIGDFRAPDLMRFGFSPLFLRYQEVWDAADIFENTWRSNRWRAPQFAERRQVT